MQPHVLDTRALVALRKLLAIFILFDLQQRYGDGKLSLGWYTSGEDEEVASILAISDTPHGHPLHKDVWFYRGSAHAQRFLFLSLAVTSLAFLLGIGCGVLGLTTIALYLQVTALHGRCEPVNDGSDRFLRTILLWCTLLPLNRHLQRTVRGAAPLGLTCQLVAMYWGTVAHRWNGRMWWPPHLNAVHYVLTAHFATRDWPRRWLEAAPTLGHAATACAMAVEVFAPLALLLTQCDAPASRSRSWRAGPCVLLAAFQLALLATVRLVNWQLLGALVMVAWLPTATIDRGHRWLYQRMPIAAIGPPSPFSPQDDAEEMKDDVPCPPMLSSTSRREAGASVLACALLAYIAMLWCGERQWLVKPDNGDVGEALRIGQNWVMFGPEPPVDTHTWRITGGMVIDPLLDHTSTIVVDVLEAIKAGRWHGDGVEVTVEAAEAAARAPTGQSYRFVNMRWERVFFVWAQEGRRDARQLDARLRRLGRALCVESARRRLESGHAPLEYMELSLRRTYIEPRCPWRQYPPLGAREVTTVVEHCDEGRAVAFSK